MEIMNLEPRGIWKNFYSLTQIPRPSKNEARVIQFVKEFGEKLGLETIVDEVGNVIIRKPASPGMENRKGIILQAHLDMVPQKNSDTTHDFEKDPIEAYIDGDWVTAKGTTLGSDNGIGAAAAMAVLESDNLIHGPVEALFTIDEETGMTGAENLKPGLLKGDILLNMDSEDEGELYIGCAGGVDTIATFKYATESAPAGHSAYKLAVTGLKGGHSGLDIHLNRGNACILICKIIQEAAAKFGLRLVSINAGSLRNAIPREGFAEVMVPDAMRADFETYIKDTAAAEQQRFADADPGLMIRAERIDLPVAILTGESQAHLTDAVVNCPNGALAFDKAMPTVVETSSNLAIIKMDDSTIEVSCLTRSAVDSERDKAAAEIANVFRKNNASVKHQGAYPGWKPNVNSPVLNTMKEVYRKRFGKVPEVKVIHAGLECGILGSKYPHWDMISFGPTIRFPHSPDEKVNIVTVAKFWEYLLETMKNIPEKS